MLSQGGYIIGYMATLLYPDGIEIRGNYDSTIKQTSDYLRNGDCILFEAAIESGEKIARIDILEKVGQTLHLVEVKAKSYDSNCNQCFNTCQWGFRRD